MIKIITKPKLIVAAPISGWCASLDDSPDPAFRDRVVGDGVSIDPIDGKVVAPFEGYVTSIAATKHAVGLRADSGVEILVHVGIDTVALRGNGFTAHVDVGQFVSAGEPLITFDLDVVTQLAPSLRTPVLLIDNQDFEVRNLANVGRVEIGEPIFQVVERSKPSEPQNASDPLASGPVYSKTIIAGLAHGVHARPAASLVQSIKACNAKVSCSVDSQQAVDARSATSLMSLGIRCGTSVTVSAHGGDAEQAVNAFVTLLEPQKPSSNEKSLDQAVQAMPVTRLSEGSVVNAQSVGLGLAIGQSLRLVSSSLATQPAFRSVDAEVADLADAIAQVAEHLGTLASSKSGAGKEVARAHIELLDDPAILGDANSQIAEGVTAISAWNGAIEKISKLFLNSGDKRLSERADDLRDVGLRVHKVLAGSAADDVLCFDRDTILIADTLLPSQLLELEQEKLVGICTAAGGTTSHVSILAASMGIPMLVAAGEQVLVIDDGSVLLVDADFGELHVSPDQRLLELFEERIRSANQASEQELVEEFCLTRCGQRVHLNANIGSLKDAVLAVKNQADGCGLLRTEFVFMDRLCAPSIEEQTAIYQEISNALAGRPMIARLLDAGADKPIAFIDHAHEENPALGIRGIRLSLGNDGLLLEQLEALLRVESDQPLKIMIPMVSSLDEVTEVRSLINQTIEKLNKHASYQLGVMIETPAAALISDKLAPLVDFFSIGTNDLTQYTLAMDRGEPKLATQFDSLHPAVLRLIANTANSAKEASIPVSVCGSVAADLLAAPILIGLGVHDLSMVSNAIVRQKASIKKFELPACRELAEKALSMSSAQEVRLLARNFIDQAAKN